MNEKYLAMALMNHHTYAHSARHYKIATHYMQPPIVSELQQYLRWTAAGWPPDLAYLFTISFQDIIKRGQEEFLAVIEKAKELDDPTETIEDARAVERETKSANYLMELLSDG